MDKQEIDRKSTIVIVKNIEKRIQKKEVLYMRASSLLECL